MNKRGLREARPLETHSSGWDVATVCTEVAALKGTGAEVQHFADHIIAERYGRLVMIPTEVGKKTDASRKGTGHRHLWQGRLASVAVDDDHSSPAMSFFRIRRTVHQIARAAIGTRAAVTMLGSVIIRPLSWAAFTR